MLTVSGCPPARLLRLDLRADALRDGPRARAVGAHQHEHELLAAVACREVHAPAARLQDAGDAPEGRVAELVPEGVVELLELVAVDEQQADHVVVAPGAVELLLEALVQVAVVVEAGEAVGDRLHLGPAEADGRRPEDGREGVRLVALQ